METAIYILLGIAIGFFAGGTLIVLIGNGYFRWRIRSAYQRGLKSGSVAGDARAADYERMWCDARREIATLNDELDRLWWAEQATEPRAKLVHSRNVNRG